MIRRVRGWMAANQEEVWEYREMLYFLVWADIKVLSTHTVLGVL